MIPPPCFVCGKSLEPVFGTDANNQPDSATAFSAAPMYGSGVWDGINDHRQRLEINVCDSCMLEKHDRVIVVTAIVRHDVEIESWNPESVD